MSAHGSNGGMLTSTVIQEKAQMQHLNDKLSDYMQRMRALRQAGPGSNAASFSEAMKQLEDEMMKVKSMYDNELARLRRDLQDAQRARAQADANNAKAQGMVVDLQSKLEDETDRNRQAQSDIAALQRALADKEKELAELRNAVQARNNELERLRPDNCKMKREYTDLQNRLDKEQARRTAAEDKLKQIGEKSGFESRLNDQRVKDMEERLRTANNIIAKLENKLKQLMGGNDELGRIIQKMRDASAEDLKRYQKETEDALNKSLASLKNQLDNDTREKERLLAENAKLKDALRQVHQRLKETEGQLQGQMQQNDALRKELEDERARSKAQLRDLECKLRDLQEQLMGKVKDFNQARDAQASLRNEIETYRQLLEADDMRSKETASRSASRATPSYGCNGLRKSGNLPDISTRTGTGTGRGRQNGYNTTYRTSYNSDVFKKDLFTY